MNHEKTIFQQRMRRRRRVRNRLKGDASRPRLSVFRSHKHTYVQLIDDHDGRTLVSASTHEKDAPAEIKYGGNKGAAMAVGKLIAERAMAAGIKDVAFDRREYKYHGRIAALADAAREAGLNF
ncbi:MAG TPA: 50S ribosomal protein L18 [Pirellulales bacterium]|jgi:large subunit ribosomal protein L18|nr:50S ribosomal protein L18 [Pirellulales bacterium]